MAVQAAYEVHIDLNGNRQFADANEDLGSYWKKMSWKLGKTSSFEPLARAATLQITLKNEDGRFSPEHASGLAGFQPGALIRVRSVYSAATRQHFIGWIDPGGIQPAPGTRGRRETVVTASGFVSRIQNTEAFIPVQEAKRSDT